MNRVDVSLLAGGAATVLTLTWPFWRDIILVRVAAVPLSPGLLLSTEPYGGPFNASFNGPTVIMASVINGVLWVGIVRAVCRLRDFVRVLRS